MAPEILNQQVIDEKCDVWSLGILMYVLLCGNSPYKGTDPEIIEQIKSGKIEYNDADWGDKSNDAKDLIKKLLKFNKNERICTSEAYSHPWIQQNTHVDPLNEKMMKKILTFYAKNKIKNLLDQLVNRCDN